MHNYIIVVTSARYGHSLLLGPVKAAANLEKHGVSFETAMLVFADPFALSDQDRIENGERRWRTIGSVHGLVVLLVAHTWDEFDDGDEGIRVISARAATSAERRRYEEEKYGHG